MSCERPIRSESTERHWAYGVGLQPHSEFFMRFSQRSAGRPTRTAQWLRRGDVRRRGGNRATPIPPSRFRQWTFDIRKVRLPSRELSAVQPDCYFASRFSITQDSYFFHPALKAIWRPSGCRDTSRNPSIVSAVAAGGVLESGTFHSVLNTGPVSPARGGFHRITRTLRPSLVHPTNCTPSSARMRNSSRGSPEPPHTISVLTSIASSFRLAIYATAPVCGAIAWNVIRSTPGSRHSREAPVRMS